MARSTNEEERLAARELRIRKAQSLHLQACIKNLVELPPDHPARATSLKQVRDFLAGVEK